jgi:hypothetical protein
MDSKYSLKLCSLMRGKTVLHVGETILRSRCHNFVTTQVLVCTDGDMFWFLDTSECCYEIVCTDPNVIHKLVGKTIKHCTSYSGVSLTLGGTFVFTFTTECGQVYKITYRAKSNNCCLGTMLFEKCAPTIMPTPHVFTTN